MRTVVQLVCIASFALPLVRGVAQEQPVTVPIYQPVPIHPPLPSPALPARPPTDHDFAVLRGLLSPGDADRLVARTEAKQARASFRAARERLAALYEPRDAEGRQRLRMALARDADELPAAVVAVMESVVSETPAVVAAELGDASDSILAEVRAAAGDGASTSTPTILALYLDLCGGRSHDAWNWWRRCAALGPAEDSYDADVNERGGDPQTLVGALLHECIREGQRSEAWTPLLLTLARRHWVSLTMLETVWRRFDLAEDDVHRARALVVVAALSRVEAHAARGRRVAARLAAAALVLAGADLQCRAEAALLLEEARDDERGLSRRGLLAERVLADLPRSAAADELRLIVADEALARGDPETPLRVLPPVFDEPTPAPSAADPSRRSRCLDRAAAMLTAAHYARGDLRGAHRWLLAWHERYGHHDPAVWHCGNALMLRLVAVEQTLEEWRERIRDDRLPPYASSFSLKRSAR